MEKVYHKFSKELMSGWGRQLIPVEDNLCAVHTSDVPMCDFAADFVKQHHFLRPESGSQGSEINHHPIRINPRIDIGIVLSFFCFQHIEEQFLHNDCTEHSVAFFHTVLFAHSLKLLSETGNFFTAETERGIYCL